MREKTERPETVAHRPGRLRRSPVTNAGSAPEAAASVPVYQMPACVRRVCAPEDLLRDISVVTSPDSFLRLPEPTECVIVDSQIVGALKNFIIVNKPLYAHCFALIK